MSKKPVIIFCAYDHPDDYVGGPNVWLERTLPLLAQKNISLHLLLLSFCVVEDGSLLKILKKFPQIKFHAKISAPFLEDNIQFILKTVEKIKPDVFVPSLNLPACFAASQIKAAGIPTVGVLHSTDAFYQGIKKTFLSKDEKLKPFRFSALVSISTQLTNDAAHNGHPEIIYKYLNYGCPLPPKKTKFNPKKISLVYTGRLEEEQKKISQTTSALCRAVNEIPNSSAEIIGDGPARPQLEKIISQHNTKKVKLIGRVEPKKIIDHLLKSQIFIFLSAYEGLGLSLAEAMACGLVPICYNMPKNCGIYDLIEDKKTGIIVNDRNEDFIKKLKKLIETPKKWHFYSKNARQHIKNNFGLQLWADKWYKFICQLAKMNKSAKKISLSNKKIILPPHIPEFDGYGMRKNFKNQTRILKERIFWHVKNLVK